jgi:hypothetical protein
MPGAAAWLRFTRKFFKFHLDKQTYAMIFIHLGWEMFELAIYDGDESPGWSIADTIGQSFKI